MKTKQKVFTAAALFALLLPASGQAATLCATSTATFQTMLNTARDNNEADVIRLAVGTYEIPAGGSFTYLAEPFNADASDLTISGGWTSFMGNPCGQRFDATSPLQTTLDGDDRDVILFIDVEAVTNVTIERVAFVNGNSPGSGPGGLLIQTDPSGSTSEFFVNRCAFVGNQGGESSALALRFVRTQRVQNSLFVLNEADTGPTVDMNASTDDDVYFINNTVYENGTGGAVGGGRFLSIAASGQLFVANNLFWNNDGDEVQMNGPGEEFFRNNNYADGEVFADVEIDNIQVAPVFSGTLFDFTPAEGSALVDAGYNRPTFAPVPPPFEYLWSEGGQDFAGNVRRQNGRIDIGAFESPPPLFGDGFEDP